VVYGLGCRFRASAYIHLRLHARVCVCVCVRMRVCDRSYAVSQQVHHHVFASTTGSLWRVSHIRRKAAAASSHRVQFEERRNEYRVDKEV